MFLVYIVIYIIIASAVYQWGAIEYKLRGGDGSLKGNGKRINWWDHSHHYDYIDNYPVARWLFPIFWPIFLPVLLFCRVNAHCIHFIYRKMNQTCPKIKIEPEIRSNTNKYSKYQLGDWKQ